MCFTQILKFKFYSQNIYGTSDDIRIHLISDNSGYFLFGTDNMFKTYICRYLFSNPTEYSYQRIEILKGYMNGQIMLSDNEFFALGLGNNTPSPLDFFKFTFGSSSIDWIYKMIWSSSWTIALSESLRNLDKTKIYSFFVSDGSHCLFFITLSSSSGGVLGSRYRSSSIFFNVYGLIETGDYVMTTASDSSYSYVITFNTTLFKFILFI